MSWRNSNHKRIYVKHFGKIPKDKNGRVYDIHHIDGDHKNNDPTNLIAIPIQDHYEIHLSHNEFDAARLIALRMNKSPREISELSRKAALQKFANGTHHFIAINKKGRPDMKGENNPMRNPEVAKKVSEKQIGKIVSDETRQKQSESHKKRTKIKCVYCDKLMCKLNHDKWHGERCTHNPNYNEDKQMDRSTNFILNNPSKIKAICEYCNKMISMPNYHRWHGSKCKQNHELY